MVTTMTEGEQTAVLGETAAELAQARKQLACLNAKADGFRQELRGALALLESRGRANIVPEPVPNRFPSLPDIEKICSQIQETEKRVEELEEHLKRAGVIAR